MIYYIIKDKEDSGLAALYKLISGPIDFKIEGYNFYKYKFECILETPKSSETHRLTKDGFEEYYDEENGWEENYWPYLIEDMLKYELEEQNEYPFSYYKEFNTDEEAMLWFNLYDDVDN